MRPYVAVPVNPERAATALVLPLEHRQQILLVSCGILVLVSVDTRLFQRKLNTAGTISFSNLEIVVAVNVPAFISIKIACLITAGIDVLVETLTDLALVEKDDVARRRAFVFGKLSDQDDVVLRAGQTPVRLDRAIRS